MSRDPAPTALITGGASGIGASVVERWVRAGGRVAILDRDQSAIDAAVLRWGDDVALGLLADVRRADEVERALTLVDTAFGGRLDAVVNCAGIAAPIEAARGVDEEWTKMVDIHLNGTMRVCRASFKLLSRSDRAAIVNMSSIAAQNGLPLRSSYSAAKAGVEALTRSLAVEWSPSIRVNSVAPGYVWTQMSESMVKSGKLDPQPVIRRTPLRRFAEPTEIAGVISFLLSAEASFITGETIRVDGGLTIEGDWYGVLS